MRRARVDPEDEGEEPDAVAQLLHVCHREDAHDPRAHAGLATAPSRIVRPPRVAASPAALECKVTQVLELKDIQGKATGGVLRG